jgi:hypothetical protein
MKLCIVGLLLLCAVFPLSAQTNDRVSIYIPPITGTGSTPEDNEIFSYVLAIELRAWNFRIVTDPSEAEYSLVGTLADSGTYYGEDAEGRCYLLLSLNKGGITLYEQGAFYTITQEANAYIPSLLRNIFSNIFDIPEFIVEEVEEPEPIDEDAWRNKQWYLGAEVFWNPRLYYGDRLGAHLANFGLGLSVEYHFHDFMAAGTGLEVTNDYFNASLRADDDHHNTILQIPLLIKYVWRHDVNYMHTPYAGIQFNLPLFLDTTPAIVSWQTGFQFGMKAGPGVLYADARYSTDFGSSGLHKNRPHDTRRYNRYMIYLGAGYKYDLVTPAIKGIKTWWSKITGIPMKEDAPDGPKLYGEGSEEELDALREEEIATEEEITTEDTEDTEEEGEGEEEAPEEVLEEAPEEALEETIDEAPEEALDETMEEAIDEAPEEVIEETPEETLEEAIEETPEETPEEAIEETPEEAIEEMPEEVLEETLEEALVETIEEELETLDEALEEEPKEALDEVTDEVNE